ncbi:isovaleryl-CoA dehydrogenase [bacterium]|nr:isovaleryl-CoA dehydrogenase [bacterium]
MIAWSAEQKLLEKTVSEFAKKELLPLASEIDEKETWNETAFRKMASLGLLGITVSEEFGGIQLGALEATLVMEILGKACASTTLSYLAHTILTVNNLFLNASESQKQKYLPDLVAGTKIGAMAMTEPGAGSDALGMTTRAEKRGNKYILNGSKTYITNGAYADVLVVYARTGSGRKDISTFIVEKDFPGFKVSKKLKKMGMKGSPTAELSFDQCEVPEANLVGKENQSVSHMMNNLNMERVTISGISLGIAQACLDYATQYASERTQFGTPLNQFQMIQERLAEMATQLAAGKALVYSAAQAFDRGERSMSLGAQCKLFTAKMATEAGLEAIQILGGYGYMREYPVERFMRDAKLMEIGAGTNEVMRLIIARELYK